ncbi:MAG: DedA family protein [Rhodocyclales bacterium]|nr:DedA family protein [Rhodocyclales bacterium]MDD3381478.1 DedA family protein [Rugosibacter sp.]
MEILSQFIDIFLHIDKHLTVLLAQYGVWIYAILFAIIFCETGLVIMPFLPGDSLLFVAGALAATSAATGDSFNITVLMPLLMLAAILGDNINYSIGRRAGQRILTWGANSRFFNRHAYDKTHAFYDQHGGKTLIIARFMPLIRTFAPFVAGVARMNYTRFFIFNVIGGVFWIGSLTLAGYWFGNLPWVKANLTLVIFGIIGLSLMPMGIAWLRHRLSAKPA